MNENLKKVRSAVPFINKVKKELQEKIGQKDDPLILIQGGFGKNNTGDDTLLLVARDTVLSVYPNAQITALCYDPSNLKELYNIDGAYYCSLKALKKLFKCDGIIIAGGGLVNDLYSNSYLFNLFDPRGKFALLTSFLVSVRKKFTCIFLVGIHVLPNFIVKGLLRLILPKINVLGIRDLDSAQKLDQLGIRNYFLAHDAALLYKNEGVLTKEAIKEQLGSSRNKLLIFNFRYIKEKDASEHAISNMVNYLHWFRSSYPDYDICMIPFSVHPTNVIDNDFLAMREVKNRLAEKYQDDVLLVEHYLRPSEAKNIMRFADLLVLTRHHALVLSYEYQIPTIVISYNVKCRQFAQLAEYRFVLDYNTVTTAELSHITQDIMEGDSTTDSVNQA